ncbi:hypothetical protein D4S03_00580 [bacterium]|nr:MAG: hypothetical protein D4S03_00580 [bacterium]
MSNDKKSSWGSPRDWWTAIGVLIAAIGLLSVISSIWTPDAAASAATGFLGSDSIVPSAIILVVGLVIAAIGRFIIKPKA